MKRLEIRVWVEGDRLRLLAQKGTISPELRGELAGRKAELIAFLKSTPDPGAMVTVPANRIFADTPKITPQHLPLISLSQSEIDHVVRSVEGGVGNVQDIYPLAPLQEGILFHHRLQSTGDSYLYHRLFAFDSAARGQAFIGALQWLVDRHDILRTAVVWEQLREPVQVVWRRAVLPVETRSFDLAKGGVAEQLLEQNDPRHTRLDLTRAPLQRIVLAQDRSRWLLLFLSHHLVMDHATQEFMWEEIAAQLRGEAQQLPPPVPFRNFVALARGGDTPATHEAFFRELLGNVETPTMPFGLTDVPEAGSAMAEAYLDLSPDLARRLRTQARHLGVTPASVCHLAWALVLSRCCGQDDVVFGTVLSARLQGGEGIARAFGLLMNTVPIRITCDARPVAVALRETQQRVLALISHVHSPLSLAQRCSAIPAPTPLFSALFNYRHGSAIGGFSVLFEGVELLHSAERTHYPFSLSVDDLGKGFGLTAQVAAPVDPAGVCAFTERALAVLVDALEHAPQTPLCELDILPDAERHRLLVEWNATAAAMPETCVHREFEAIAARTPYATALVFQDKVLSYAELNARANRLAHTLIGLGVTPDARVAIALERSPAMVVALLATLKAGGAYVPLDPDYPAERLALMLEDSGARILITQEALLPRLPHAAEHVLCVDADGDGASMAQRPDRNPDRPVAPDSLAYVIYTSGSTGRPKGVEVRQEGLLNFLLALRRASGLSQQDSLLAVTTVSFDIFGLELYLPLMTGGRVVLATKEAAADPQELSALLLRHDITAMQATPSTWRMLIDAGWSGKADLKMLVGGEALPGSLAKELLRRGSSLWNLYGPTETTIWSSMYPVAIEDTDQAVVPIGRPIANTQLYVLDRHNHPTPIGVPGELHIGGLGAARGYLNRSDLTAERFIPDPFSGVPGARLYKTGDLVRYRPDGNLEFLGRLDQQVKIRGFRIELGEIEAALAAHPAIREAVVVDRTEATGEKRLVAYVVLAEAARSQDVYAPGPTVAELRAFLRVTLPDYMLPAAVVVLPAFPLTPSGKVDRRALPAPEPAIPTLAVAPRTATEATLAQIWAKVLQTPDLGVHDNFFEIGGHSLLATQVASRVTTALGVRLPLRDVFAWPTVASLAAHIETLISASPSVGAREQGAL